MRSFKISFEGVAFGESRHIEFQAEDASRALIILAEEDIHDSAELWEGSKRLATLQRTGPGSWQVAP